MIVGIHQPNYAPWCGYFHKLARSDVFVFLDDAQYPKNSYVNRVKILENGKDVWLTIPAKVSLGTPIHDVTSSQPDWPARHLDRLKNAYKATPCFQIVWPDIEALYASLESTGFAEANRMLICALAEKLGLSPDFRKASDIPNPQGLRSDDRLIDIVLHCGGDRYLSGKGGQSYQDPEKFKAAGIGLEITAFANRGYPQTGEDFVPGLSVLDAVFHLGWNEAAAYIREEDFSS